MKYNVYLLSAVFLLFLFSNFVFADIGPKPTADIEVTYNGHPIEDARFYAKMLECRYSVSYDESMKKLHEEIKDLPPLENYHEIEWYDKCKSLASKQGLDPELCNNYYSYVQYVDNSIDRFRYRCDDYSDDEKGFAICKKLTVLKILDSNKNCYWTTAELARGGNCKDSKCSFTYMLPDEFKLAVFIPSVNKTFISNELSRTNFNGNYKIDLSDNSAKIVETAPPIFEKDAFPSFIKALTITLIFELIIAFVYLSVTRTSKRLLLYVLVANLISLPIVWFVFPLIKIMSLVILSAEIFAIVFEAYFIFALNKSLITLKRAFILSIIMNFVSLFIGGYIFLLL